MTDESDFPSQIEGDKNRNSIYCQYCNSIMLKPKTASYVEDEVNYEKLNKGSALALIFFHIELKVAYFKYMQFSCEQ